MEAIDLEKVHFCISHDRCDNQECLRKPAGNELSNIWMQEGNVRVVWGDYHNPRFGLKCQYFKGVDR